jgi:hypothetical protein
MAIFAILRKIWRSIYHDFGEWEEDTNYYCWQVRTCKRHGCKEGRPAHTFGEWLEEAPDSCYLVRTCSIDGIQERKELPHQFSDWSHYEDEWERYEHHTYILHGEAWDYRTCKKCGYVQKNNFREWYR